MGSGVGFGVLYYSDSELQSDPLCRFPGFASSPFNSRVGLHSSVAGSSCFCFDSHFLTVDFFQSHESGMVDEFVCEVLVPRVKLGTESTFLAPPY